MLTYKETINKPRLEISCENNPMSPREWSCLGYFFTKDNRYRSPDGSDNALYKIMLEAEYLVDNADEHMDAIKKLAKEQGIDIIAIYPVVKYEHSAVVYKLGQIHGFDYSNNGFYIITKDSQKELGTKRKDFEKVIKQELADYNQYINGEIYRFILYNEKGEQIDSCGGFYDIDDIKEYLPDEWQDEVLSNYFIN
jgi:hypothetical protein